MTNPLVSVIIPTFNRCSVLENAIKSVLNQTYEDLEIIVVDDGSTDETEDLIKDLRKAYPGPKEILYKKQSNQGVSVARNLEIRSSVGKYVAFLDSDDTWLSWKIETQVKFLEQYPNVNLVWTDMSAVDEKGSILYQSYLKKMYSAYDRVDITRVLEKVSFSNLNCYQGNLYSSMFFGNLIHTSTVLIKRNLLEKDRFNPLYQCAEDYDLFFRLCKKGLVAFLDRPSTNYTIHSEDQLTSSKNMTMIAKNNLDIVKKYSEELDIRQTLKPTEIKERISESYHWVASQEMKEGHYRKAISYLICNMIENPGVDSWIKAPWLFYKRIVGFLYRRLVPNKLIQRKEKEEEINEHPTEIKISKNYLR